MRWLISCAIFLTACSAPPPPTPTASKTPTPVASPTVDHLTSQVLQVGYVLEVPQGARRAAVLFQAVGSDEILFEGSTEPFEAASLVKLPILAELYRRAEAGELKLSDKMVFEERFRVGGSGDLQKEPAGKSYTLEELGTLMITVSDNVATDMLLEKLGMAAVEIEAHNLGMKDTTVRRTIYDFAAIDQGRDNVVSARDMAAFFSLLDKLPGGPQMRKILTEQKRNEMIPAGLPKGTKVAHKSGELTGILHDCGIVSTPHGDYILVLMGEWDDREQGVAAWKKLSADVYKAFNR